MVALLIVPLSVVNQRSLCAFAMAKSNCAASNMHRFAFSCALKKHEKANDFSEKQLRFAAHTLVYDYKSLWQSFVYGISIEFYVGKVYPITCERKKLCNHSKKVKQD